MMVAIVIVAIFLDLTVTDISIITTAAMMATALLMMMMMIP